MKTTWLEADWCFSVSKKAILIADLFYNRNYMTSLACIVYLIYVSTCVIINHY